MRQPFEHPKVISGRGQLFQHDHPPIDVRYQIVLTVVPTALTAQAACAPAPAAAPDRLPAPPTARGSVVLLNRADLWRIDPAAEYNLALTNGKRCRVALHHDPHQPFTKYRILCLAQDLL